MTSVVEICNMALANKLGASRINSLGDGSKAANAVTLAYPNVRDFLLRLHPWKFTKTRVSIAADTEAPLFGYDYSYQEPGDSIRILAVDSDKNWVLEGSKILTDEEAPLKVLYQKMVTDPNEFEPIFVEALATRLAYQICEEITQSTAKKNEIARDYRMIMTEAKAINAQESSPSDLKEDDWITARY